MLWKRGEGGENSWEEQGCCCWGMAVKQKEEQFERLSEVINSDLVGIGKIWAKIRKEWES